MSRVRIFAFALFLVGVPTFMGQPALADDGTMPTRGEKDPDAQARVVEMYESIHYKRYKSVFSEGEYKEVKVLGTFAEQSRALKTSGRPDTYWITGWSDVPVPHRRLAIIQGGINRTWLRSCHADFEQYLKRWARARAAFADDIAFIRDPGTTYYAAAERLKKLWDDLSQAAKRDKLWLTRDHALNKSNMFADLVTLEYELAEQHKRSGLQRHIAPRWAVQFSRVAPASKVTHRMVYCRSAAREGTPTLPRLPQARVYSASMKFIRYIVSPAEEKAAKAWARSSRPKPSKPELSNALPHLTTLDRKAKKGTLTFVGYGGSPHRSVFPIKSIKRSRGRALVKLAWSRPGTQKYGCKTTNKLQRIDSDGTLLYYVNCKSRPTRFNISVSATFTDLPANIKKGDELGFYGRLLRLSLKRSKTRTKMTATVHPLHIREVQRGGKTILSY